VKSVEAGPVSLLCVVRGVVVGLSVVGGGVVVSLHVSSISFTSHMMPSNLSTLMYAASLIPCMEPLNGTPAVWSPLLLLR
jgi:hypothetical protein